MKHLKLIHPCATKASVVAATHWSREQACSVGEHSHDPKDIVVFLVEAL